MGTVETGAVSDVKWRQRRIFLRWTGERL